MARPLVAQLPCRASINASLPHSQVYHFCSSPKERLLNLEAVVQGCGFKAYPWAWWWMPLRVRLKDLGLLTSVPMHLVKSWYDKGFFQGGAWEGIHVIRTLDFVFASLI